jgi:ribosomal protein L37E
MKITDFTEKPKEHTHYDLCERCGNRIYNKAKELHVCTFEEEFNHGDLYQSIDLEGKK